MSLRVPKAQIYLLHFDKPYWKNCRHYVGYTTIGVENRVAVHRRELKGHGRPSMLVDYALQNGCDFQVALVEDYDCIQMAKHREYKIKRRGVVRCCPICKKAGKMINRLDELMSQGKIKLVDGEYIGLAGDGVWVGLGTTRANTEALLADLPNPEQW